VNAPQLINLGPALVCALSWYGAGAVVPKRLLPQDALLRAATRIALGMTVIAVGLYLIGRAGVFERWFVAAITVALAAVGAVVALRSWRRPILPGGRLWWALVGATALGLVLDLVAATAPPSSADALKYHLTVPNLWLEAGRVTDVFWQWISFNPFGIELLFAQGLALSGGGGAGAVGALLAVAAAVAVYGLGRELAGGSELAGAAAAALFSLQAIVTWEATSAFIELGTSFFVALGAWHVVRYVRAPALEPAAWSGFAAGAVAGTKYVGVVIALVLGVYVAAAAVRARRGRDVAVASACAIAAGGMWYVKNLIVAGNPVYPLFFGGKLWTPGLDQVVENLNRYGVNHGLLRLPILPFDLLVHGGGFDRGQYVGTAVFVAAIAAVLLRIRGVAALWLGVFAYLVVWAALSAQSRFLLPALAVLAAAGGAGVEAVLARGAVWRWAAGAVAVAGLVHWLLPSVVLTRQLLPSAFGLESYAEAAQRLTGTYDALHAIGRDAGDERVAFGGYPHTFYFPGRALQLDAAEFAGDTPGADYIERLRDERVGMVVSASLGMVASAGALTPELRGCVQRVRAYQARMVLSRALGDSVPLEFVLYRFTC
jgi:hypothetical protein